MCSVILLSSSLDTNLSPAWALGTTCENSLKEGERGYCEDKYERETGEEVPTTLRPRGFDPYEADEEE